MVSMDCINLVKQCEGCRLTAYQDATGVWTIGYGHTQGVTPNMAITQYIADLWLLQDIQKFNTGVLSLIKVPITQSQEDALTSFAYNVGLSNFKSSTLLKKLNNKDYEGASNEFERWTKAGKKVLNGLVKRRKLEKDLFVKDGLVLKVVKYSLKADGEKYVSPNFKVKEFKCKDGSDEILIDIDFVTNKLQKIRDHFNQPIIINSAYRTPSYNQKVGGATNSYHMQGRAFDIVVKNVSLDAVCKYAQSIGVKGIIRYNNFNHIDSRETLYYAINDNGKVTKVNGF